MSIIGCTCWAQEYTEMISQYTNEEITPCDPEICGCYCHTKKNQASS